MVVNRFVGFVLWFNSSRRKTLRFRLIIMFRYYGLIILNYLTDGSGRREKTFKEAKQAHQHVRVRGQFRIRDS